MSEVRLGLNVIQGVGSSVFMVMKVKNVYVAARTKYQEVQIVDLEEFGRSLVLDGYVQSTEADEFLYHESLVQPAMTTHPNPARVLVIGGGEGATLREVLKHNTVVEAIMVDIDGELVEFAKKYLEVMHRGSFSDPRAKVLIMDGLKYVEEAPQNYYDVIVSDLTDPYGPEISRLLYSAEFYAKTKKLMRSDGILVTQAGSSFFFPKTYKEIVSNLRSVFKIVREYWTWIPSFGYACNYVVASDVHDPLKLTPDDIDKILKNRGVVNRYYDGKQHQVMFTNKVIVNHKSFK
ncbi:MAG: polyamine aminopropyltransferase [Desulfurococcaceae archaeon TW002]